MKTITFHITRKGKNIIGFDRKLNDYFDDNTFLYNEDEDGNELPAEEWKLTDGSGNIILEGKQSIESETGVLNFDEDYDTIIVDRLDNLSSSEIELLREYYLEDGYIDYDVLEEVLEVLGYNEISNIKMYRSNAEIFTTSGFFSITRDEVLDMDFDEMTEYVEEIFRNHNISPLHMEKIEQITHYWDK